MAGRRLDFCFGHLLPIIELRDLHNRNETLRPPSGARLFVLRVMAYVPTAGVIASPAAVAPTAK